MEGICRGAIDFAALDNAEQSVRIRFDSTVVSVRHDGDATKASSVHVDYTRGGKLYRIRARSVIMAG